MKNTQFSANKSPSRRYLENGTIYDHRGHAAKWGNNGKIGVITQKIGGDKGASVISRIFGGGKLQSAPGADNPSYAAVQWQPFALYKYDLHLYVRVVSVLVLF